MKKIFFLTILLLIITACQPTPRVEIGGTVVRVEIADDPGERQQGLMHREHLDPDAGMLFLFENERKQSFWMKNTLIPLDIIFINNNYEIINIAKAVPCKEDPCDHYPSSAPAKYVLEVNAGFAEEKGIMPGDKVEFFLTS